MSSTTKPTIIDKYSKEEADSLDTTSDLYHKLAEYEREEKARLNKKKNRLAEEIALKGNEYLSEIETKNQLKEEERLKMIDFIINKTEQKLVRSKELYEMPYEDVNSIYIKAQDYNKSWFKIFIEFLFGW